MFPIVLPSVRLWSSPCTVLPAMLLTGLPFVQQWLMSRDVLWCIRKAMSSSFLFSADAFPVGMLLENQMQIWNSSRRLLRKLLCVIL